MSESSTITIRKIAILGGTGKEGKGLAYRWAKAGKEIIIGSRTKEKAETAAKDICVLVGQDHKIIGEENLIASQMADLIVLTVPFSVHKEMLAYIRPAVQGKILVDVTVPLVPPKITRVQMPPAGSAALESQGILGDAVQVVAAFQNISYDHLLGDEEIECDVLVCGNSKNSRSIVIDLVRTAGLVAWDAGPLDNSMVVEGLTSILIGLNKQFGTQAAGIRITGLPKTSL
jgi:NADPH-dependent F420 reductase